MTVKEFFKSTAFKCIVVLLCVLLISGVFLTIMNGLLAVSDEEKFNRKVGNLYTDGSSITTEVKVDTETKVGDSTIEKVWFIPEKNDYLVQVYGQGRDGKITIWVIISTANNKVSGVGTVLVYDKVDSEYAYKIDGWNSNIPNFSKDYVDGIKYAYGDKSSSMYINTGASTSFTAISACVNDAITYIQAYVSGGPLETPPYDSFLYNELINQNDTTIAVEDGKLVYNIKTKGYDEAEAFTIEIVVNSEKKIESFEIKTNGSTAGYNEDMPDVESIFAGKGLSYFTTLYNEDMDYKGLSSNKDDNELTTGASNHDVASKSTYLCAYAAAFAIANYDDALLMGLKYTDKINMDSTSWTVEDGKVTYNIITKGQGEAEAFTIEIVVNSEKKIESFTIVENGSTAGYDEDMPDVENIFVSKALSYFTTLYNEDMDYKGLSSGKGDNELTTGASNADVASKSTYLCAYAAAFATANYDVALLTGGSTNE